MCQRRKKSLQYPLKMIKFYIELLYDSGSQGQSPKVGGKGSCMNQNGFTPRSNMPGYSYIQPNTYPQNAYQGTPAAPQGGMQNSAGYGAQTPPASAFSFTAPQNASAFGAARQAPATGGYAPVPPTPATGGYMPVQPGTATGGFQPVQAAPAAGGYNPVPPAQFSGGYSPVPPAQVSGGFSPVPPMAGNNGYSPVPPAAANAAYPVYHPQTAPSSQAGSFIPKTPYSPGYTAGAGYAQGGYQKPAANGYPQGYSAFTQMGRNVPQSAVPQTTAPQQKPDQVPLNGGGYIPHQVRVRRRPPEKPDIIMYAAAGVLVLLFILGMFVPVNGFQWLKWLFLIPTAAAIAALWLRPFIDNGKRLCFSIVGGALCVVMIVSMFGVSGQSDPTNKASGSRTVSQQTSQGSGTKSGNSGSGSPSGSNEGYGGSNYQEGTAGQSGDGQSEEAVVNAAAKDRLRQVFICWSSNDLDKMVELCLPSWRVKQENAKKTLFQLLQNRTPIGNVQLVNEPAQNGDSLSFILQVTISRNNGKDPILSQMTVRMVIESGIWYVDPNSLKSNEIQETPDPNATPEITPAPTPYVDGNTVLYYNPDGGKLYHLDANCISVHSKYTPLKGSFRYSQINDDKYAALEPCNVCAAPLRNP